MTRHYASAHCATLSPLQNKAVFNRLPQNCTALVTTVATLRAYRTNEGTDESNVPVTRYVGVATIERDDKKKKYFFRFYNMNNLSLILQREIKKSVWTPLIVVRSFLIKMEFNKVDVLFEFFDTILGGADEYSQMMQALRGDLAELKSDAEIRYYENNPHIYSYEKHSRFSRLLHRKKYGYVKKFKHELPHSDKSPTNEEGIEEAKEAKEALTQWKVDPGLRFLLRDFGIREKEVFENKDFMKEIQAMSAEYGGMEPFMEMTTQCGLGSGLDKSLALTPVTSPGSLKLSLHVVPKTPDKLLLDSIAAFEPAEQVEISKNDDLCKTLRLEEEEEFVASELIPGINAFSPIPKPSTTTGEAASSSPAKPGTPEKVAEPAAKEKVAKRLLPEEVVLDINKKFEIMTAKLRKRKAEKKHKKRQKNKKRQQHASKTPEQTSEKEAPMPTEKTPVKEASKTPEKDPASVSDTTEETESDTDDDASN